MGDRRTERQPNDLLRQERLLRGWSQQQVANHVGTDGYTVNRWERGRALPSPYFRQHLCTLFGKNAEELGLLRERLNGMVRPPSVPEHLRPSEQGGEEISLAHPLLALSPYWQVPSPRNAFFTGREDLLHQLHQRLCQQRTIALTPSYALSGLGGIGKTATVLEFAYRSFQDYSAVFWIE